MPAETLAFWPHAGAFLLTMARIGSAFAFFPMPGWRGTPQLGRSVLIVAISLAVSPIAKDVPLPSGPAQFGLWLVGEFAFGLAAGLVIGLVSEGLLLAAQLVSAQAGYSFATTFDPSSQADSGVLQLAVTLGTNLMFFSAGLDQMAIRAFAASLGRWPAGGVANQPMVAMVINFGGVVLETGIRLAVPIAGFLLLTDLFLALAGRLHSQLQLLSVAFPVKMMAALTGLAALAPFMATLYSSAATKAGRLLESFVR